jgi:hypothetical protein
MFDVGIIRGIVEFTDNASGVIGSVMGKVGEFDGGMGKVNETMRTVAGAAGTVFAGLQVADAIEKTVNLTGRLTDLGAKVGISTSAVQELDFAARQNGGTFEMVSGAITKMNNNLVEGPKSAVSAMNTLGLSIDDMKALSPDMAFEQIATAIAGIPDPMNRSKLAMDIFGKAGAALLPTMTGDIGKLRQEARDAGVVIGDDLVAAGDDLGDAWDRLQAQTDALKAKAMLPFLKTVGELPESMQLAGVVVGEFAPVLSGLATTVMAAGGPVKVFGILSGALSSLGFLLTMPAGAVVAAIVGVVAIWKNWDKIEPIVMGVYNAVKTWLLDKFTAIVDGVKGKIDAVTGYFRGMYDAVVGHSYVPDMITGIGTSFAQLPTVMVNPTMMSNLAVEQSFASTSSNIMTQHVSPLMTNLTNAFSSLFGGGETGGLIASMVSTGLAAVVQAFANHGPNITGQAQGIVGSLINIFSDAFGGRGGGGGGGGIGAPTGGGGGGGLVGTLMTVGLTAAFGPLGPIASAGLQVLAPVVWDGVKKIGGFFNDMFGGPNARELGGRAIVAAFEDHLSQMLTDEQRIQAGNESWKQTVIAVRDAYIANGIAGEEAMIDVAALWDSSKGGADAVNAAVKKIEDRMKGLGGGASDSANEIEGSLGTIDVPDIEIHYRFIADNSLPGGSGEAPEPDDIPGFRTGTGGFRNFGRGTAVMLHGREEVRTEHQARNDMSGTTALFHMLRNEIAGMREDMVKQLPYLTALQLSNRLQTQ